MQERVDVVVVGAGVVGLAIARTLALRRREVIVLESADRIGSGISSRNSEVIHAGIYYPRSSLKARLCIEGKDALYEYCAAYGVPHNRCGKLIVAASEKEKGHLAAIRDKAAANGVDDLEWLTSDEVRGLEPEVKCVSALLSPSTGIIDSHALMLSLVGEIDGASGHVVSGTRVTGITPCGGRLIVATDASDNFELAANLVVIAAGLGSQKLAALTRGFPRDLIPPAYLCRGNYFLLDGARPFSRLIYPVPDDHSLGIHATIDMQGAVRFGPDVEWIDDEDYEMDPSRAEHFYHAIRNYYPELKEHALSPGYAGIRPRISGPESPWQDFQILGPGDHGIRGLAALFGIESPGLTACLSIGEYTVDRLLS